MFAINYKVFIRAVAELFPGSRSGPGLDPVARSLHDLIRGTRLRV